MKNYGEKEVSIFGFKWKVKSLLLTLIIACATLLVLILLDTYVTDISWYGVIIGTGFLVALALGYQLAKERGLDGEYVFDLIIWIFPLSIVGARLYYVLNSPSEFKTFYDVIAIWHGGMAIYGGIIGGLIGVIICSLIKKKSIIATCDMIVPCLIIAQSIGRWGNFVNQEVYGLEVTNKAFQWFPISVHITKGGLNEWHLATFFYESILNLIGFFLLTKILRKSKINGIVTSSYLIFYGAIRFVLEGLREDEFILKIPGTNFAVSKVVSLAIMILGVVWLTILLIKNKKNAESK